jgi:hypothetical protein
MRRRSTLAPDSCVQRTAPDTVATAPDHTPGRQWHWRPLSGSGSALGIGQNHLADRNPVGLFYVGRFFNGTQHRLFILIDFYWQA